MKHDSKASGGREAGRCRDLRHCQIGVHEKILGAIDMRLANLVGNGVSHELLKSALEGSATQRDVIENIVNLQRLRGVFADEPHGQNNILVFDG